ncbi:hypothetical protein MUG78_17430 [Gordonia alkaliphila]|uniref:hypothetical protein n=1 Tax=Gordonia alkaliphila TaxID=1053547 RepID=UPI001FF3A2D8|nr:hypothetical protein [Gordonia alkaliphila]MCK0441183.1 hypothetical protein [Gordonia alkaliphila]
MSTIDLHWKGRLREIANTGQHTGAEIGEDDPGNYLETDSADEGYLVVGFTEYLNFPIDNGDLPSAMVEEGWLTDTALTLARDAISEILTERSGLPADVIETLSVDHLTGDYPGIAVEVTTPIDDPRTVEEVFGAVMNRFWAALTNMTDPGTFNYPYLWSRVA